MSKLFTFSEDPLKLLHDVFNSVACWSFFVADTVFWCCVSISSITYNPKGNVAHFCMRGWSKTVLWFCRIKINVDGIENIDKSKIQIFASNHTSHFDIFILSAVIPVKFGWVAKSTLFKIPFMGWHMKLNGYISIDRSNKERAIKSMDEAALKVKMGNRITLFPEGTRSRTGELLPFKKGLFHLCLKTGVPIVPIYIKGAYDIIKPDSLFVHPGQVYVKIGKELQTSRYNEKEIEKIMNDLRQSLSKLKEEVEENSRLSINSTN
jgi:1-acyl-sn-glycerol-3-phosphate acyltransferase